MEKTFNELYEEARAAVAAVSAKEAREHMLRDPNVLFVDPRNAEDIIATTGIIPGALNVPLSDINESADDELPRQLKSRSRRIIAACEAGPMGALAAHALQLRGFENVSFIDGGTRSWLDAGFATAR